MNIKVVTNISLENATDSSTVLPSKAEGIALCTGFILSFMFIVVGNLLVIVWFAVNRRFHKRSLFLVINMAFADLMLGTLTLPLYICRVGKSFQLWNGGWVMPLSFFHAIVDTLLFFRVGVVNFCSFCVRREILRHLLPIYAILMNRNKLLLRSLLFTANRAMVKSFLQR